MYAYLKGKLAYKTPDYAVVDVNGVGYKVFTTNVSGFNKNENIQLFTYLNVRETEMTLYGFVNQENLSLFEQLITVNGIGPKVALNILNHISAKDFYVAVMYDDEKALTKLPGIGKKTAKRIILDLKEKLSKMDITTEMEAVSLNAVISKPNSALGEVIEALIALGYDASVANRVANTQSKAKPDYTVEQLLKLCLRSLATM